jgi:hypothetical protein
MPLFVSANFCDVNASFAVRVESQKVADADGEAQVRFFVESGGESSAAG